ncbi:MAG: sodium:solute symporter family protein [Planctomycetales bacterium]|nr:sodium:solute symporter family protein [Planctomycetales bacterium]
MDISVQLRWALAGTIVFYVVAMYALSWIAQKKIHDNQDYLVAGRRLPLSLAWMTLLATWFGAGTLITATDEVRDNGVTAATLDPLGAGVCLLLAGVFVAAPLWRMQLLTFCDLFRERFDARAEFCSALISVPSYFGWIAAQFYALAAMLELFFNIDPNLGLLMVAVVGTGYTLMGGMWSVTLTDAVQIVLILVGLVVLAVTVLLHLGDGSLPLGLAELKNQTAAEHLELIPSESTAALLGWLSVLVVGALGNLTAQDLLQRIFAARSEKVARHACYVAGTVYLTMGTIPVGLGLASAILFPDAAEQGVMATLAQEFLSPPLAIIFTLVVMSAILSTIDSALLGPASIVAQNILPRFTSVQPLLLNRLAVVGVGLCSLGVAYMGEDAYSLLEQSYSLGLVGLFVPMMFAIYTHPRNAVPALASMVAGTLVWAIHFVLGWDWFLEGVALVGRWQLPMALSATAISLAAYLVCEPPWRMRWHAGRVTNEANFRP